MSLILFFYFLFISHLNSFFLQRSPDYVLVAGDKYFQLIENNINHKTEVIKATYEYILSKKVNLNFDRTIMIYVMQKIDNIIKILFSIILSM